jgi:hypothetical protein
MIWHGRPVDPCFTQDRHGHLKTIPSVWCGYASCDYLKKWQKCHFRNKRDVPVSTHSNWSSLYSFLFHAFVCWEWVRFDTLNVSSSNRHLWLKAETISNGISGCLFFNMKPWFVVKQRDKRLANEKLNSHKLTARIEQTKKIQIGPSCHYSYRAK